MPKSKRTDPIGRAEEELDELLELAGHKNVASDDEPAEPDDQQEPPQDEPQSDPPAEPREDPNSDSFKHRWESLQGIYKSQQQQLSQVLEQNKLLMDRLENASRTAPTPPTDASQDKLQQYLSYLEEEHGQTFVEALSAYMESRVGSKLSTLEQRLQKLEPLQDKLQQVEELQLQERSNRFKAELTGVVPDWEQLLGSDDFGNWAQQTTEQFTQRTFADLFDEANGKWNLSGMAGIFNAYKTARGIAKPQTPSAPKTDPRATMVAPQTRGRTSTPTAEAEKIWKASDVDDFYRNYTKYSAEEALRLENEIFRANAEGRIMPG